MLPPVNGAPGAWESALPPETNVSTSEPAAALPPSAGAGSDVPAVLLVGPTTAWSIVPPQPRKTSTAKPQEVADAAVVRVIVEPSAIAPGVTNQNVTSQKELAFDSSVASRRVKLVPLTLSLTDTDVFGVVPLPTEEQTIRSPAAIPVPPGMATVMFAPVEPPVSAAELTRLTPAEPGVPEGVSIEE